MSDDLGPVAFPAETILTTEDVARWLRVSPDTVMHMGLPKLRIPGRTVRYSAGAILRYLEGRDAA